MKICSHILNFVFVCLSKTLKLRQLILFQLTQLTEIITQNNNQKYHTLLNSFYNSLSISLNLGRLVILVTSQFHLHQLKKIIYIMI